MSGSSSEFYGGSELRVYLESQRRLGLKLLKNVGMLKLWGFLEMDWMPLNYELTMGTVSLWGNFRRWGQDGRSRSLEVCLWRLCLVTRPFLAHCFLSAEVNSLLFHMLLLS
jgi:hypothetical protein